MSESSESESENESGLLGRVLLVGLLLLLLLLLFVGGAGGPGGGGGGGSISSGVSLLSVDCVVGLWGGAGGPGTLVDADVSGLEWEVDGGGPGGSGDPDGNFANCFSSVGAGPFGKCFTVVGSSLGRPCGWCFFLGGSTTASGFVVAGIVYRDLWVYSFTWWWLSSSFSWQFYDSRQLIKFHKANFIAHF